MTTLRTYFVIYFALLALTIATTGVAYVDLAAFSTVVAIVIAAVKTTLIVLFFMHMLHSTQLTRIIAASALVWFLILITLTFGDYVTRGWLPVPGR